MRTTHPTHIQQCWVSLPISKWLWLRFTIALFALMGCASSDQELQIELRDNGLEFQASNSIQTIELHEDGKPLWTHRLPVPADKVYLPWDWEAGQRIEVRALTNRGWVNNQIELPRERSPFELRIEAPLGQTAQTVSPDAAIAFPLIDGGTATVALRIRSIVGGEVSLQVGDDQIESLQLIQNQEHLHLVDVNRTTSISLSQDDFSLDAQIAPLIVTQEELSEEIKVVHWQIPSESNGQPDPARPFGRIDLPAPWWETLLEKSALGFRPRDVEAPWAWQALTLKNTADRDLNVSLQSVVLDGSGQPDPAFRPRIRTGSDGTHEIHALLHIPAGQEATATLPVFVDDTILMEPEQLDQPRTRKLTVTPLGSSEPIIELEEPLTVSRGSTVTSLSFGAVVLSSIAGFFMLFWASPKWIRQASTSELSTISMFGTLLFGVSAATQLASISVSGLLGPFSILVTGLIDDALRVTLIATLISIRPKVGTVSLAVLVAWLLRGFTFGDFSPSGIVFLFSRLLWLEVCVWIFGLSRSGEWRHHSRGSKWLRFAGAIGVSSVLSQITGLALAVVLYRLFFADWYVALMLLVPGFLYPIIACAIAIPFADRLYKVAN